MTTSIFDNAFRHVDPAIRSQFAVDDAECCDLISRACYQANGIPGPKTALATLTKKSEAIEAWEESQAKKQRLNGHYRRIRPNEQAWNTCCGDTSEMADELATLFIKKGIV